MTSVVERNISPGRSLSCTVKKMWTGESLGTLTCSHRVSLLGFRGPQDLASCGDGCQSLFLGLWKIWTWAIREHLPIFTFHKDPKVCRACMLKRKVIHSHYHEANPALVPWEIVRL